MKIFKYISNDPANMSMSVKKGVLFQKIVGEVTYGKMLKFEKNEPTQYGYVVHVGNSCIGSATDFNVSCDMLLEELKILNIGIK